MSVNIDESARKGTRWMVGIFHTCRRVIRPHNLDVYTNTNLQVGDTCIFLILCRLQNLLVRSKIHDAHKWIGTTAPRELYWLLRPTLSYRFGPVSFYMERHLGTTSLRRTTSHSPKYSPDQAKQSIEAAPCYSPSIWLWHYTGYLPFECHQITGMYQWSEKNPSPRSPHWRLRVAGTNSSDLRRW